MLKLNQSTKIYQASTSELYGLTNKTPQNEETPFYPRSPYAAAKLYAYWITINYREAYNIFACNGILFNHESKRRGETFVTRKITRGLSRVNLGLEECIYLGNLDSKRDWGHAKDYVEMQWMMLQQEKPKDYVIATGRTETVRKFVELSAKELGWNTKINPSGIVWEGEGLKEVGKRADNGKVVVKIDSRYFRPTEVDRLLGDAGKAKKELGWIPRIGLEEIVSEMITHDLNEAKKELILKKKGYPTLNSIETLPNIMN